MIDLRNMDCMELLSGLPDKSVDFVCIDPPYGILTGHKIETVLDIPKLMQEIHRVSKNDTFFAFFGMMPTIVEWYLEALKVGFKFAQEIIWCKRTSGIGGNEFNRIHENIYIMRKGKAKYVEYEMKWEDVSQAMVYDGIMNIETVYRELGHWKGIAQGKTLKTGGNGSTKNDTYFHDKKMFEKSDNKSPTFGRETTNLSTIWSFLPHNRKHRNSETGQIQHPTVKSIDVLQRLIKLCTTENATVLDCFSGSGTTAIACIMENRNFIGSELDATYYENSLKRIETAQMQPKLF